MNRTLAVLVLGTAAAGLARADVPPPPGFKRVAVEHKIATEKEYPGYLFFAISGGDKATPVKLDPKTPAVITAGGGRYRFAALVAVPKDAAKQYETEKEFHAALAKGKVDGLLRAKTSFTAFVEIKDGDPRKTVVEEYQLEKVDAKDGIVLGRPKKEGTPKDPPQEESDEVFPGEPTAAVAPRGQLWVAGLAAFAGIAFAGLWLARRQRGAV
ncbi:MAG: hypothetical protein JWO38_119 [Gemmataceae bacterium]|nr:hypothetical protein [Gemmataceae bacterium]